MDEVGEFFKATNENQPPRIPTEEKDLIELRRQTTQLIIKVVLPRELTKTANTGHFWSIFLYFFFFFFFFFSFFFFFFFFLFFFLLFFLPGLILPIVRFWYEHMVPAALRMDQGHFGQELSKWRIQGNFSPRGVVQVCQRKTSPEGKPRTTSSQYHLQADIRRIGAERYWTDIKGPVLTHGELDRNLDVATIVFSEEYKQLIAILGKRTLNLNEDKFLALYNAHRGVKGGIQVILLSEFFLSFIYFVRFVARMRRGSSTAK